MPVAPSNRAKLHVPGLTPALSSAGWTIRSHRLVLFVAILATMLCRCRAYGDESTRQKEPVAPVVDFQALVERDSVKRGEAVTVFYIITNKSNIELKNLKLSLLNPGALIPQSAANPDAPLTMFPPLVDVPAFGTLRSRSTLTVSTAAEFAQHRLIFALDYTWEAEGKPASSAQATALTVPVVRQFEEEAKGLPGGTAPIFYLLMPIIPAILTYEFFNSIRRGDGVKVPQFKTEYIVPSFLLAVLLGFASLFAGRRNASVDYSSSLSFVVVIMVSAALGAAIVALQWICNRVRWWRRGFESGDSEYKYLSKALLLHKDGKATWATGTVEGQQWQGVLLIQPDKTYALGARMQISVASGSVPSWDELIKTINTDGTILDRASLRRWLSRKKLKIEYVDKIKRGGENVDKPVVCEGLQKFTPDPNVEQPMKWIVRPVN